jgi:hypothetical protein
MHGTIGKIDLVGLCQILPNFPITPEAPGLGEPFLEFVEYRRRQ